MCLSRLAPSRSGGRSRAAWSGRRPGSATSPAAGQQLGVDVLKLRGGGSQRLPQHLDVLLRPLQLQAGGRVLHWPLAHHLLLHLHHHLLGRGRRVAGPCALFQEQFPHVACPAVPKCHAPVNGPIAIFKKCSDLIRILCFHAVVRNRLHDA